MKNPTSTHLPTILTLTLPLLFSPTTTTPLSPLSLPTLLLPHPNQTPPGPTLQCFNGTEPTAHPLNLPDCDTAIDLLIHDPSGIMHPQTFSWHGQTPSTFSVPAEWAVGQCQITLATGIINSVDEFRLVDVAVQARRVMEECVPVSKLGLGGVALVGHDQGFFVSVNGPQPDEE